MSSPFFLFTTNCFCLILRIRKSGSHAGGSMNRIYPFVTFEQKGGIPWCHTCSSRHHCNINYIKNQGLFPNFTLKNNSTSTEWLRTAPPVSSPLTCTICLKFLDDSVIARAYLFCRLPILPLVCFSAPIPPTPFPAGRGDYKLILPGAPPPAHRHQTVYGTDSPCRCSTRRGACPPCHLPPLPVACFSAPSPRPPSRREGGF